jgi:hypothetical protein
MEPSIKDDLQLRDDLLRELDLAEQQAWNALSRYKFQMFGYWAAIWVHLNRISGAKHPNPWSQLVKLAMTAREQEVIDPGICSLGYDMRG